MSAFGRAWLRMAPIADARGAREHRRRLVSGLSGFVVEVGAGAGLNFDLYPDQVTRVLALEPDAVLRAAAERAAGERVDVRDGVAEALPVADSEADAVVFSLVLCSVPDQAVALAEARRALRTGGELRFYEHVVAEHGLARLALQAADRSGVWPAVAGGCHPARDTAAAIREAGFERLTHERFTFRAGAVSPPIPHVLGTAIRVT
jgi:ubiquinone/menaquinone biosynthesis C-methylase UbiE